MPPAAPSAWDAPLQQLLASHVIDGYGLLDHTGKCLASFGSLSAELWGSSDGGNEQQQQQRQQQTAQAAGGSRDELSPAARQLLTLFNSSEWDIHAAVHRQMPLWHPAATSFDPALSNPSPALTPNADATPGHLDVCGQQAIIVQRSDSSVYAGASAGVENAAAAPAVAASDACRRLRHARAALRLHFCPHAQLLLFMLPQ